MAIDAIDSAGGAPQKVGPFVRPNTTDPLNTWFLQFSAANQLFDLTGEQKKRKNQALYNELDPGPQPKPPGAGSLIDPETGLLYKQYFIGDENDNPYNLLLSKYRSNAYLPEDQASAAARVLQEQARTGSDYQKQQLALSQEQQLQDALTSGASRAAEARGNASQRGGLSRAVLGSLGRSSQRDISQQLQGIRGQGAQEALGIEAQNAQNQLGITAQDLQNRQGLLDKLAGLEQTQRQTLEGRQQYNIGNAINETAQQRDLAQRAYEAQIKAYAAAKTAQGTAASGSKGKK